MLNQKTFALLAILALAAPFASAQKKTPHRVNNVTITSIDLDAGTVEAKTKKGEVVKAKLQKTFYANGNRDITLDDIPEGRKIHIVGDAADDKSSVDARFVIMTVESDAAKPGFRKDRAIGPAVKMDGGIGVKIDGKVVKANMDKNTKFLESVNYDPSELKAGAQVNLIGEKVGDEFQVMCAWVHKF